jgi:hypothetical protein
VTRSDAALVALVVLVVLAFAAWLMSDPAPADEPRVSAVTTDLA